MGSGRGRDPGKPTVERTGSAGAAASDPGSAGAETTTWGHRSAPPTLRDDPTPTVPSPISPANPRAADPSNPPSPNPPSPEPSGKASSAAAAAPAADAAPLPREVPAKQDLDAEATRVAASEVAAERPARRSRPLQPILLEWVEPSVARGTRFRLEPDRREVRLGRATTQDVRLFSGSASREHAVIEGDAYGDWVLSPLEGKSVKVDGYALSDPVILEDGMNLMFGGDHVRCLTEESGVARARQDPPVKRSERPRSRPVEPDARWLALGAGLLVVGLGLLLWLLE